MKYIVASILLASTAAFAQTTINVSVSLSEERVWALTLDWEDYRQAGMQTNGVTTNTLTKSQWFNANCTNQILSAVDRRVDIRKQQTQAIIASRWKNLTPAQQTNVLNALPPE